MDQEKAAKLKAFTSRLGIADTPLDLEFIESIKRLKPDILSKIDNHVITSYIFALSQYLFFIQVNHNKAIVRLLNSKSVFDRVIDKESYARSGKITTSSKDEALVNSLELRELKETVEEFERQVKVSEGLDEPIIQMINAFKKELQRRGINGEDPRKRHE